MKSHAELPPESGMTKRPWRSKETRPSMPFFLALGTLAACRSDPKIGVSAPPASAHLTSPSAAGKARTQPAFLPTVEVGGPPSEEPPPEGMVWIAGGEFSMGSDAAGEAHCHLPGVTRDAQPVHRVHVDGFWMDATEVTNEQFEVFTRLTGYVTIAEREPTQEEFPDAPRENLIAGSTVFAPTASPVPLDDAYRWWRYQRGASWRHPEGPDSDLRGRESLPVVHVAHADAVAYATWAGKRLPSEAQWEFAARGGLTGKLYAWGDELRPGGQAMANTYQGRFPTHDTGEDGFAGLAPVAQYPPNGYGLYDMAGNAWEWTDDWYRPDYYSELASHGLARNPRGPLLTFDPAEPGVQKRVQRGGSFLCSEQYCTRYMVGTRGRGEVGSSTNHLGFRCVKEPSGHPR